MNKRYEYIVKNLDKLGIRKGQVVDCGCGEGHGSKILTKAGFKVLGFDLDPAMVKATSSKKVLSHVGDITNLDCESNFCDVFVCSETLEHLTEEQSHKAAKEIQRICKSGAIICITVPEDKTICMANKKHKQYLSFQKLAILFDGCEHVFRGKYCKKPKRCNLVAFFKNYEHSK